ncbi:hypothetical protein [Streptomyces virginiae]|uniref:hypothetical protein n=2 Tax=Streptomyces virginiae TaxID=1961 RepID=UPI00386DE090|nr:hypothetical protein OG253_25430 [Streptomyces virginiae]
MGRGESNMVITGTAGTRVPDSGQSRKDDPDQRAAHRTERIARQLVTLGEAMSRTARFVAAAAVLAALCAAGVTAVPVAGAAEGHHVSASVDGSINWDTVPASPEDSINWD